MTHGRCTDKHTLRLEDSVLLLPVWKVVNSHMNFSQGIAVNSFKQAGNRPLTSGGAAPPAMGGRLLTMLKLGRHGHSHERPNGQN
jgi:hypothetical protein